MITEGKLPASNTRGPKVLGEGTIISGQVEIEDGVQIGHYCVVEGAPGRKTVIGSGTVLEDFVRVYPGVFIGEATQSFLANMVGTVDCLLQDLLADREILSETLHLNMSMITHRTNEVVKRLTLRGIFMI